MIEQDYRFVKKIAKLMMGFKAFHSAKTILYGIEAAYMIWKDQLIDKNIPAYKQFIALADNFIRKIKCDLNSFNICDRTNLRKSLHQ